MSSFQSANPTHAVLACVGSVMEALDCAAEAPTWALGSVEKQSALVELTKAQARLAELRLRVLASADADDLGADVGATSTAAWLAHQTRQTRPRANADSRLAKHLAGDYEATRCALASGRVNEEQARVIVAAIEDLPESVPAPGRRHGEEHLLEKAADFDANALRILGRRLLEVLDPDAAEEEEGKKLEREEREARRKTWLRMRDNGDGTHSGSFKIPDLHAAILKKALHSLASPRRTASEHSDETHQRLATPELLGRGLTELLERLPAGRLPASCGKAATIVVTLSLESLLARLGVATLDEGTRISAAEARRLACAAGIIPLVLGGDSMPLDVGRTRRLHTESQRVALAHRDKGCTAETCDRPAAWCDVHHEEPWSAGGGTSVENGRLLCSRHHHLAHSPAFDLHRLPSGQVRFVRRQ